MPQNNVKNTDKDPENRKYWAIHAWIKEGRKTEMQILSVYIKIVSARYMGYTKEN